MPAPARQLRPVRWHLYATKPQKGCLRHGPIVRILAEHTPRKCEVPAVGVDHTMRPAALQIIQIVDVLLRGADRRADQLAPKSPTFIPCQSPVASVFAERGHHSI